MTRSEAIEIVTCNEKVEFFKPLVSEPGWTFNHFCEYYNYEPYDSDDLFILECDIINRIESCGFDNAKENDLKNILTKREMKKLFYYSRTYVFQAPIGHRKHYFFNLVERHGNEVSFRLNDKGDEDVISSAIAMDGDVETASFVYKGIVFELGADNFISKGYSITSEGQMQKKEDRLKDAHLHTIYNREEIEVSDNCGCISCQRIFPASEVEDYIDGGITGMCPYCNIDAVIGDASGIKITNELFAELNKKYF